MLDLPVTIPSHAMRTTTTDELQMKDQSFWSVQSLCAKGIKEVPKEYVNPVRNNYYMFPLGDEELPVIDFADIQAGSREELAKLVDACENWGFFQLANHGVSEDLVVRTTHVTKQFFDLSPEDKKQFTASDPNHITYGYGRVNHIEDEGVSDWGDTFAISEINISTWPKKPEQYRETVLQYNKEIKIIGYNLLNIITSSLGLPEKYIESNVGEVGLELGSNLYPRCPQPDLVFGISPHSDPQYMTFVLQDMEGLQVLKDERWMSVKPLRNHFVVNLGDQIQILSNGKYKRAMHRVVVNNEKDRLSIATFIRPSKDAIVGPAPQLIDEAHPPKYKTRNYEDFLRNCFVHGFLGKNNLDSFEV